MLALLAPALPRAKAQILGTLEGHPAKSVKLPPFQALPATPENYRHFASQTQAMLHHDILDPWYPRSVDTEHGGFHAEFDRQWRPLPSHGKFSVC